MTRFIAAELESTYHEGDAAQALIGYPAQAVLTFPVMLMHPYKLARGLQTILSARGVKVFERSPVRRIEVDSNGVTVHTTSSMIHAQKAVLTTNAYINRTDLELDIALPATSTHHTYLLATERLPMDIQQRISPTGQPFGDPTPSFFYGRLHDHRLLLGGIDRESHNTPNDDHHLPSFQRLHAVMVHRFPFLADVPVTAMWGGAVQETSTEAPIVRHADDKPNIVLNMGHGGGSGVGMGLLSGRLVAALVLEQTTDADALRLIDLYERSRFPLWGPIRAVTGVVRSLLRGCAATLDK